MENSRKMTSVRGTKTQYADVVLLEYLNHNPMTVEATCPAYLKSELRLGSFFSASRRLARKQYCRRWNKGFIVTDKGRKLLEDYKDYIKFFHFASPYVKIQEYQRAIRLRDDGYAFESTMINLYLKKAKDFMNAGDYESAREIYLDVGALFEKAERERKAFYYYLLCLRFDVNCVVCHEALSQYIQGTSTGEEAENLFEQTYHIRPQVLSGIRRLADQYGEELIDFLFEEMELPVDYCSDLAFGAMVKAIISDQYDAYQWKSYFLRTYKRFLSEYSVAEDIKDES